MANVAKERMWLDTTDLTSWNYLKPGDVLVNGGQM